jgi:acyl transferase domain-containing protein
MDGFRGRAAHLAAVLSEPYPSVSDRREASAGLSAGGGRRALELSLCVYLASLAAHHRLQRRIGDADRVLVGHSFGEVAALVAAGAFSLMQGAEIVAERCAALAAHAGPPLAMATVHAPRGTVRSLLESLAPRGLALACENSSTASVLVGPAGAITAAAEQARRLRVRLTDLVTATGAHHPAMNAARARLVIALRRVTPQPLQQPVYSPLLGRFYTASDDLTACLAEQLVQPVWFADAIDRLVAGGTRLLVECGPLRGLAATLDCEWVSDETCRRDARAAWHEAERVSPLQSAAHIA